MQAAHVIELDGYRTLGSTRYLRNGTLVHVAHFPSTRRTSNGDVPRPRAKCGCRVIGSSRTRWHPGDTPCALWPLAGDTPFVLWLLARAPSVTVAPPGSPLVLAIRVCKCSQAKKEHILFGIGSTSKNVQKLKTACLQVYC